MPTDAGSRGRGLILKAHAERIKPGPRPRNRRFSTGWRDRGQDQLAGSYLRLS